MCWTNSIIAKWSAIMCIHKNTTLEHRSFSDKTWPFSRLIYVLQTPKSFQGITFYAKSSTSKLAVETPHVCKISCTQMIYPHQNYIIYHSWINLNWKNTLCTFMYLQIHHIMYTYIPYIYDSWMYRIHAMIYLGPQTSESPHPDASFGNIMCRDQRGDPPAVFFGWRWEVTWRWSDNSFSPAEMCTTEKLPYDNGGGD